MVKATTTPSTTNHLFTGPVSRIAAVILAVAVTVNSSSAQPADALAQKSVTALLEQMTPAEKAAQLTLYFALSFFGQDRIDQYVRDGAGALLYVTDPREANRLQRLAVEETRLGIPLMFALDVVHGHTTIFPVPIAMAASWDPDFVAHSQAIAAAEARASGIHWTFAPTVDVTRDPRWGRIVEGAGEDPYLAGIMGAAQVRGFQGPAIGTPGRVIAGPKHFAGYGAPVGGRDYDEVNLSDNELWNVHLPPFKAAIDAGAGNIMTAYMALNGIPTTANRWLLRDVLREQWGFEGWVVSDNSTVRGLVRHGVASDEPAAAALALRSGLDMEMAFGQSAFAHLPDVLANDETSEEILNEAVRRILTAKFKLGLFDDPYLDESEVAAALRRQEDLDAAQRAAERSAVLLRNEASLLPLDRAGLTSVAVIGPLADSPRDALGPWVTMSNEPVTETILEGIRNKFEPDVAVSYSPGVAMPERYHPSPLSLMEGKISRPEPVDDDTGISDAVAAVEESDVAILVLGEAQDMIGELASRSSLDLPGRQQELLDAVVATGKPVVVLLMSGRPLDLKETEAQAILKIWYPGSRGGSAVANLLLGDAVPGGKLPFTWPRNVGQVPMFYSHLASHDAANTHSRYWNEPGAPTYPFGHGLSYSTFSYSNIQVSPAQIDPGQAVTVTVDLENTGTRKADEVAQLYLHQRIGSAARPVRELKGFQRVTLEPGERRQISFTVGPEELRYWNAAIRDWVIDTSTVDVAVGGDSTAPFSATFSVVETKR